MLCTSASADLVGRVATDRDLFIAQFDMKPDHDDVQAAAALGSMLRHPDFRRVRSRARLIVYGAIGNQRGTLLNPTRLFNEAFGEGTYRWTDAINQRGASVGRCFRRARDTIKGGGRVYVQEAGQSDFTREWIRRLRVETSLSDAEIKRNVVVVQHSDYNEEMTTPRDLRDVRNWATYVAIDDGNDDSGTGPNRGRNTPNYTTTVRERLREARNARTSPSTFRMWRIATNIIENQPSSFTNRKIANGGLDFSDCVENWYIFGEGGKSGTLFRFWNRFVKR